LETIVIALITRSTENCFFFNFCDKMIENEEFWDRVFWDIFGLQNLPKINQLQISTYNTLIM